ncbi:MAG: SAM-dependent methyltransferase [Alphaproteobacteria bacterium]
MTTDNTPRGYVPRSYNLSDDRLDQMKKPAFPRAATYDPDWVLDNEMGPNVLWLTEWAMGDFPLKPGMRVLDLGCGKALSSIFLAKEYDVTVWAADLWIPATDNWRRIEAAGFADRIFPIHAEAHDLPFADDYFDAIVSFDAYHYFGTDDLYLGYISRFLKPGGWMCAVLPTLSRDLPDGPPATLKPYWDWQFGCFHSIDWWRQHWQKSGLVSVERAEGLPDGWELWAEWCEICAEVGAGLGGMEASKEAEMLRLDGGETFGFGRIVASKPGG